MRFREAVVICGLTFLAVGMVRAVNKNFHDAPDSAKAQKNPYEEQPEAVKEGKTIYARNCLACHGKTGQGTGNVPSLVSGKLKGVTPGEIFWFITKGSKDNGMPSWAFLPEQKRWQVVTYIKALEAGTATGPAAAPAPENESTGAIKTPAPHPPFTDFRFEKPGTVRKITVADLPEPYATDSARNGADLVTRPQGALPVVPSGFKVELYAAGLDNPR